MAEIDLEEEKRKEDKKRKEETMKLEYDKKRFEEEKLKFEEERKKLEDESKVKMEAASMLVAALEAKMNAKNNEVIAPPVPATVVEKKPRAKKVVKKAAADPEPDKK
jgi:ATP-dependent 26S proteasome regulatory subunit